MITITNSKLKSFVPKWARYHGFSVLFDNPEVSLHKDSEYATLVTHPKIDYYAKLGEALNNIGGTLLTNTYLFAPLPFDSYHVTAWDGINEGNLLDVHEIHQPSSTNFINTLPHSITSGTAVTDFVNASPLLQNPKELTFRFDTLYIWGNDVLVAALRPIEESINQFNEFKSKRTAHNDIFTKEFGTSAHADYCPHISIGYFANQESAQLASVSLAEWRGEFSQIMAHKTIAFTSLRLYGFTDMATFVCKW